MRFNCLLIILAHRGYKEARHFQAHHPPEPWELSRLKNTNSSEKGVRLEQNGSRCPWLNERIPIKNAWWTLTVLSALSNSIRAGRRGAKKDGNLNSQPPSAPVSLFRLIVYLKFWKVNSFPWLHSKAKRLKERHCPFEDAESNKWADWILFRFKSLCSASSSALRCQNCLKSLALLYPTATQI